MIDATLSPLERHIVERESSFFAADLVDASDRLGDLLADARILFIGGAGSIGSQTLRTILPYGPALIHVIDHNENGLAELVRSLRSSPSTKMPPEFVTLPFDFGGAPFRLWMAANQVDYDIVFNFAALKHVRSEKDPFSVLAMLETNVLHPDSLAQLFAKRTPPTRVFSVSTDKAANPSSMMGATKRLMEHALFAPTTPWADGVHVSSARFANVAFSNGSLLQSWEARLAAGQPLACPIDCRRFFVTMRESGHLCALAGLLGADRAIAVPALEPGEHLVLLSDVVARFLEHHGRRAAFTEDPDDAFALAAAGHPTTWPVLLTPLDTGGEKPYEEFVGEDETVSVSEFRSLQHIEYLPPHDPASFAELIAALRSTLASDRSAVGTHDALRELIARVEPAFARSHRSSSKLLDERI